MASATFDFGSVLRDDLPAPAGRFGGFAKFNFIGGHNAPESIPVDGLKAAAEAVLGRDRRDATVVSFHEAADGVHTLDTTDLTIEEAVGAVISLADEARR
mgnify:CR=1 FL=1